MAITTAALIVIEESKTANFFDFASYAIVNDHTGQTVSLPDPTAAAHIDVWWNAWHRHTVAAATIADQTLVKEVCDFVSRCGPARLDGVDLLSVAADALSRTNSLVGRGITPGVAYALGQRDALYAWLQAAGYIKTS